MAKDEKVTNLDQLRSVNATVSMMRTAYAAALGYGYQGERNVYTALGYISQLTFDDYLAKFTRQDIAKTIVRAPVEETWREVPQVVERGTSAEEETKFEKAWNEFVTNPKLRVWHYLFRLDLVCGIGRYGVLYLGFDDIKNRSELAQEVQGTPSLKFMSPLMENHARVTTWEEDPASERYGQPKLYDLTFSSGEK